MISFNVRQFLMRKSFGSRKENSIFAHEEDIWDDHRVNQSYKRDVYNFSCTFRPSKKVRTFRYDAYENQLPESSIVNNTLIRHEDWLSYWSSFSHHFENIERSLIVIDTRYFSYCQICDVWYRSTSCTSFSKEILHDVTSSIDHSIFWSIACVDSQVIFVVRVNRKISTFWWNNLWSYSDIRWVYVRW